MMVFEEEYLQIIGTQNTSNSFELIASLRCVGLNARWPRVKSMSFELSTNMIFHLTVEGRCEGC